MRNMFCLHVHVSTVNHEVPRVHMQCILNDEVAGGVVIVWQLLSRQTDLDGRACTICLNGCGLKAITKGN